MDEKLNPDDSAVEALQINLDDMGRIIPFFCSRCGLMLFSGNYCDECKAELKQLDR
jgi:hypothetical protein